MSRKVRVGVSYLLGLAFYLLGRVKDHLEALRAYEANKANHFFDDASLEQFEQSIAQLEAMQGGQKVGKGSKLTATVDEVAARAAIRETMTGIRDDVKLYSRGNRALQEMFGMGSDMNDSSPNLLEIAASMLAAWAVAANQEAAIACGVTAETISTLTAQRNVLRSAYSQHTTARSEATTQTVYKTMTLAELEASCVRYRQVARRVFRKQPEILAQFLTLPAGAVAAADPVVEEPEAPGTPTDDVAKVATPVASVPAVESALIAQPPVIEKDAPMKAKAQPVKASAKGAAKAKGGKRAKRGPVKRAAVKPVAAKPVAAKPATVVKHAAGGAKAKKDEPTPKKNGVSKSNGVSKHRHSAD